MATVLEELVSELGFDIDDKGVAEYNALLGGLAKGLGVVAAAGAAAATAITALVSSVAAGIDDTSKFARANEINFQTLQKLEFAAEQSGATVSELRGGLESIQGAAVQAARGLGPGVRAFAELGISTHGANGQLKTADRLLLDVANRIQNSSNKLRDLEIAQGLGLGPGLNLLLREGEAGIARLTEQYERQGLVIDERAAAAAERYVDVQNLVRHTLARVRDEIGIRLLPVVEKFAKRINEFARSDQGKKVFEFIGDLAFLAGGSIEAMANSVKFLVGVFGELPVVIGAATVAMRALWVAFGPIGLAIAGLIVLFDELKLFFDGKDSTIGRAIDLANKLGLIDFTAEQARTGTLSAVDAVSDPGFFDRFLAAVSGQTGGGVVHPFSPQAAGSAPQTTINKVEIVIPGAGDPERVSQKVREAIEAMTVESASLLVTPAVN